MRRALGVLALVVIPAGSLFAGCDDGEPIEVTLQGEAELFPGLDYSTGLLPEGSDAQASFSVSASGKVTVSAVAAPSGSEDEPTLTGLPQRGTISVAGGFKLVGQLKVDLGLPGIDPYDGPIPGIDNVEIAFAQTTTFDPFAIGSPIATRATIPASRLPGIPLPGGIPGQLVIEVAEGSVVDIAFTATCAGIQGTTASYAGTIARGGTLVLKPVVEIDFPGVDPIVLPDVTVDLALGSSELRMSAPIETFGGKPEQGDHVSGSCSAGGPTGAGGAGAGGAGAGGGQTGSSTSTGAGGAMPCSEAGSSDACVECCADQHSDGLVAYNEVVTCVVCDACGVTCDGEGFGCGMPSSSDCDQSANCDDCTLCATSIGGICEASYNACLASVECDALLACLNTCPVR
jgi:hypothetical protein